MRVKYRVNNTGRSELSYAHLELGDLLANDCCIYLGGDLDEQDRIIKHSPSTIRDKRIIKYESIRVFIKAFCEELITHEIMHIIIFELTQSIQATRNFDKIDTKYQICAPDFWDSR